MHDMPNLVFSVGGGFRGWGVEYVEVYFQSLEIRASVYIYIMADMIYIMADHVISALDC